MTATPDEIRANLTAAVTRAEAAALAAHQAGDLPPLGVVVLLLRGIADAPAWADDMAATREVGWIAREARALSRSGCRRTRRPWAYMTRSVRCSTSSQHRTGV